ncbi:hypothetical protein [Edaphobacillus lindanitolerans]|uniref:Cell-wall binding lipoprotein n=1 Tax=Edaphobacillus lindanitolerans TaxID=550447 RepID=A0A1U7PQ19_9BACI|nr:hypothetical protein [Edaphobacillus lindanitolerans]SIT83902.1 hypothetical protein SAMN05428946_1665 [Edaphobacillus lindanitolerans]
MFKKWLIVTAASALMLGACGSKSAEEIDDVYKQSDTYKKAAEVDAPESYSKDFLLDTSIFMSETAETMEVLSENVENVIENGKLKDEEAVKTALKNFDEFTAEFKLDGKNDQEKEIAAFSGDIAENMEIFRDYLNSYIEKPEDKYNTTLSSARSRVLQLTGDMSKDLEENGAQPALEKLKEQFDALHYNADFGGFKGNFAVSG